MEKEQTSSIRNEIFKSLLNSPYIFIDGKKYMYEHMEFNQNKDNKDIHFNQYYLKLIVRAIGGILYEFNFYDYDETFFIIKNKGDNKNGNWNKTRIN